MRTSIAFYRPPHAGLSLYNHPLSPMASPSSAPAIASNDPSQSRSRNMIVIAFLLISALYFADIFLRASLKTFWYDELFTVYLCRLPSFHATWAAVIAGTDLNPPLFYLLTRWGQHFFGEGLIATRLPAILGVWVFCICIFVFVNRRLGPLYGCIAALFPLFTLAHVYAYEARPHGCVLGWCGLMLVCWQRARQGRSLSWWTLALGLCSLGALLTHVYSVYLFVPFLAVEFLGLVKSWKFHPGAAAVLLITPLCVAPLYLQMIRGFRSGNPLSGGLHIHPYEVIQHYLVAMAGPALALLLLFLLLLAVERTNAGNELLPDNKRNETRLRLLPEEIWLAAIFACIAVIGAIGVKISHGPFFDRYFLSAAAGYAILLAQATAVPTRRAFAAKGLIVAMLFLLTADTAVAAFCRWHHADLDQVEPASRFPFPPDPHRPLMRNYAVLGNHDTQPILVTEVHTYLYLYYYASPELRSRLYLGVPDPKDTTLVDYRRDNKWMRLNDLRAISFPDFLARYSDFYVYSPFDATLSSTCGDCLQPFLAAGYTLRSVDRDADNLLEHFSK
jgi:hypothetical protein